jgi:hypothetical protein
MSGKKEAFLFVAFLVILAIIAIIKVIIDYYRNKHSKNIDIAIQKHLNREVHSLSNNGYNVKPSLPKDNNISEVIPKDFNSFIPNIDKKEFEKSLYKIYMEIQSASVEFNYDKMRLLMSDELFNTYKSKLEILRLRNSKNILSDFSPLTFKISDINDLNDKLFVEVITVIDCFDYVIDTNTGFVTRGNKYDKIAHDYKLGFAASRDISNNHKCPNCGADLKESQSHECPFCNSIIVSNSHNWVLSAQQTIPQIHRDICELIEKNKLREIDDLSFKISFPDINKENIYNDLSEIYGKFNTYLYSDYELLKSYTTNEFFDECQKHENYLRATGRMHIINDLTIHNLIITNIIPEYNNLIIEAVVVIECCDYIKTTANEILSGDENKQILGNYKLTFHYDSATKKFLLSKKEELIQ